MAAGLAVVGAPGTAHAYVEAHATSDDVRLAIDTAGQATIAHRIGYRINGGPFKGFDLTGIQKDVVLEPVVSVTSDDAGPSTAHAAMQGERTMRVTIDEPKGLRRGTYVFTLSYRIDLVAARQITRDGSMWRLAWTSPVAHEGLDGARVIFQVPPAPTEPRAVSRDPGGGDDGTLATLRRSLDHDELELVRPHVGRGEAASWAVRVDPKAFVAVRDPVLRPPPPIAPPAPKRGPELVAFLALAAVAAAYALVARAKARHVAAACALAGAAPSPLVPVPAGAGPLLAGLALAAGVHVQLGGAPTAGACLVAAAMALATFRSPATKVRARGPGAWLALRPDEAFERPPAPGAWLDLGTTQGRIAATTCALVLACVALAVSRLDVQAPLLVALDGLALLPLFATGRAAQLPPTVDAAAPRLRPFWARLKRDRALRVAAWGRVPAGESVADELRVYASPRAPLPGFFGLEIGLAWARTPAGYAPLPEVLVRVHESSAAAARIASVLPSARALPGRRPEERVYMLAPRAPGRRATLALVTRLARELSDRRTAEVSAWKGSDRRAGAAPKAKRQAPLAAA